MSKIYYKTDEEIEIIRQNCLLVSKTLALAGSLLKEGAKGSEIDQKAEEFIRDHGAYRRMRSSYTVSLMMYPTSQEI